MHHNPILARPRLTAIAAVLALSSTPLFAQEIDPAAASPATEAVTPPATDPVPTATASDPLAPVAAETTTAAPRAAATRTARAPARRAATATTQPARPSAAPAAPETAGTTAPAATPPVAPVPAEALAANPMTPDVAPPQNGEAAVDMDQALPIAGAAGLALVGLAGLGLAMRRRRRRASDADEGLSYSEAHMWHEPTLARAVPAAGPATAAAMQLHDDGVRAGNVTASAGGWTTPSAFSWGAAPAMPAAAAMAADRRRSESRIDAAMRGPTPDNPSLSLKKRLRRAAFFDQRERAVREGLAEPISPMAGLPDAMNEPAAQPSPARTGSVTARPDLVPA